MKIGFLKGFLYLLAVLSELILANLWFVRNFLSFEVDAQFETEQNVLQY